MESTAPLYRIGLLLSGCGTLDGSDPTQTVTFQVAMDEAGAELFACAPDGPQHDTIHPLSAETSSPPRNALAEAARLVRGSCWPLTDVDPRSLDALLIPGGLGAVKTLCRVAIEGSEAEVDATVRELVNALLSAGKPIGALDEGVVLLAAVQRESRLSLAAGSPSPHRDSIEQLGHELVEVPEGELHVDEGHSVASIMTTRDLDAAASARAARSVARAVLEMLGDASGGGS